MAKLVGGIFSSPSGHNNGLVFGKGRTKDGKKTTVREYVKPTNPNTPAQQNQRGLFTAAVNIVRGVGQDLYSVDFNNAVKDLPGFHSLMSYFSNHLEMDGADLSMPGELTLGSRPGPVGLAAANATGDLEITWDASGIDPSFDTDEAVAIVIEAAASGPDWERAVIVDQSAVRSAGSVTITGVDAAGTDYYVGLYFRSDAVGLPADQRRSKCEFIAFTA